MTKTTWNAMPRTEDSRETVIAILDQVEALAMFSPRLVPARHYDGRIATTTPANYAYIPRHSR